MTASYLPRDVVGADLRRLNPASPALADELRSVRRTLARFVQRSLTGGDLHPYALSDLAAWIEGQVDTVQEFSVQLSAGRPQADEALDELDRIGKLLATALVQASAQIRKDGPTYASGRLPSDRGEFSDVGRRKRIGPGAWLWPCAFAGAAFYWWLISALL